MKTKLKFIGLALGLAVAVIATALALPIGPSGRIGSASIWWSSSTSTGVTNYAVYWGPSSSNYTAQVSCGTNLAVVVPNLARGQNWYFNATATDPTGYTSDYGPELVLWLPGPPNAVTNINGARQ